MWDYEGALLPKPQSAQFGGEEIQVGAGARALCAARAQDTGDPMMVQALARVQSALQKSGCLEEAQTESPYPIRLRVDPAHPALSGHALPDAYLLEISRAGAELVGYDAGGAYYAAITFAQLVHADNDRVLLPVARIVDWPSFATRGLFIENRYGSDFLTREDWFQAVDAFSALKLNALTVGVYGCWCQQYDGMLSEYLYVPFKSHPELRTPRHVKYYSVAQRKWVYKQSVLPTMFEQDYFGELIAYAKARNIRVKPLFNSFGHNTLLPRLFPELSAKDRDGQDTGFGVCTADERTYEIMNELYDEIVDRYLLPAGIDAIHIGLDEVWEGIGMDSVDPFKFHTPFCQCARCRELDRGEQMIGYILRLAKHLKSKGIHHVYVYYDMLFNEFDALNERFAQRLREEDLYDTVVIDWWDYSSEDKLFFGKQLNSLFRSIVKPITGYYHWSTPVEYLSNIRGCARLAREYGYEGMEAYSSLDRGYDRSYRYLAELAWNISTLEDQADFLARYARGAFPGAGEEAERALKDMGELMSDNFMGGKARRCELFGLDYYMYTYVKADLPYPRRFPEEVFARIHENLPYYEDYFSSVHAQANRALAFFEARCGQDAGDRQTALSWLLMAKHYAVVSGEYLGLLALERETDAARALEGLRALLAAREGLMSTVEVVRIEANQFMYLRNMTIYRQILLDLIDYAARVQDEGTPFSLDMTCLDGIKGDMLRFLR